VFKINQFLKIILGSVVERLIFLDNNVLLLIIKMYYFIHNLEVIYAYMLFANMFLNE